MEEAGRKLGLDETYIPHSYIEQVQLEKLTDELRQVTDEIKDQFTVNGQRVLHNVQSMSRLQARGWRLTVFV